MVLREWSAIEMEKIRRPRIWTLSHPLGPSTVHDPALSASPTLTDRMVALAGARTTDTVAVAGPRALDVVIDLCRRGFEQVTCGCAAGLPCAGEHSSVLFVDGPLADDQLAGGLGAAASLLADRAVLVMRLSHIDQDLRVVGVLERSGLELLSTVYDLSCETLVAHRLLRAERLAKAA